MRRFGMSIFGWPTAAADDTLVVILEMEDGSWLYLYIESQTFRLILPDGTEIPGSFRFEDEALVFALEDGTEAGPELNEEGAWDYSFTTAEGLEVAFTLTADFVTYAHGVLDEYTQTQYVTAAR